MAYQASIAARSFHGVLSSPTHALCGDAVAVGQFLQRGLVIFVQPAGAMMSSRLRSSKALHRVSQLIRRLLFPVIVFVPSAKLDVLSCRYRTGAIGWLSDSSSDDMSKVMCPGPPYGIPSRGRLCSTRPAHGHHFHFIWLNQPKRCLVYAG